MSERGERNRNYFDRDLIFFITNCNLQLVINFELWIFFTAKDRTKRDRELFLDQSKDKDINYFLMPTGRQIRHDHRPPSSIRKAVVP